MAMCQLISAVTLTRVRSSAMNAASRASALLLRFLGPLVVVTTLAVLGSGLALIALGPDSTHTSLIAVAGLRLTPLTIHQATFIG